MEKKQHPSYGMIRFARSSIGGSGTALFGSSIMHNNVIRLSISKGMMEREGNEDWFLAGTDINDMIVEVEMSYTQFAEAITSLNIGEGIPVTITKVNGTFVEPCPYSDRQKVMRREVDEATRDLVRQLEKRSEEIEKLLDEKRVLSREDRRNGEFRTEEIKNILAGKKELEIFDENLYRKIIARIWVHGGNMAEVEFINGSRVTAGYKD